MFSRFIIIGVGLLGGSLGLALRQRHPGATIFGVDRFPNEAARQLGAVDVMLTGLDSIPVAANEPTLAIVCTPVGEIRSYIHRILEHLGIGGHLLVTDVGSTKASICREIDDLRFLGSHPIAGSQRSGFEAAQANLFENRVTVLTPTARHDRTDIDRLRRFWSSLGSTVMEMDAEKHDKILAVTSHLPHLLSASLAATVTEQERPFTGTGYADMTRLAAGSPEVWRDIFLDNDENVLAALRRFQARLAEFAEILQSGDAVQLEAFLRRSCNR